MSEDLVAFIRARLDEDEAAAKAATESPWAWEATGDKDSSWAVGFVQDEDGTTLSGEIEHGQGIVIDGVCEGIDGHLADAAHIARHDPARVLREVEAKRTLVTIYTEQDGRELPPGVHDGRDPDERECDQAVLEAFEDAVRILGEVYSDHPDYKPEWKWYAALPG